MKKIVKERLYEKFEEKTNPIKDMKVGTEWGYRIGSDEHTAQKLANIAVEKSKSVTDAIKEYDKFYHSNPYMTSEEKKDWLHKLALKVNSLYKEYKKAKNVLFNHTYETNFSRDTGTVIDKEKEKIYNKIRDEMYNKIDIPSDITRIGFWSDVDDLKSVDGK